LCEKFCIDFHDSSTNNPTAWQWIFPGGSPASSTDQNPTNICYNVPGVYDVTLITTSASGNDTTTLANYITVNSTPAIPTITQAGYTLTSSPASSYQWQLNSVDIPGATNQSYTALQSGYYTVIVGDSNGCKNSASKDVLISGINEAANDAIISVNPNPSSGNFTVEILNEAMADDVSIDVVNTLGQIVYSSSSTNGSRFGKKEIHLPDASRGIYFLEIKSSHLSFQTKIMIQ
jgi:PKD repeat protein